MDGTDQLPDALRPGEALVDHGQREHRVVEGLRVVEYNIPEGCIGGYYPECNVLMPVWHYAVGSKTPAAKSIPVTVESDGDAILEPGMEDRSTA